MKKIKKLVFATNNKHKLEEARQIISNDFEIVSLSEINCHDDIPETADTLEGNALIKARWIKDKYGYDCFADDTGLMVDSLDGAPGVLSARYAGEHCSPADNVRKLLDEMKQHDNRNARFATVVALICDGEEHTFEGRVEGLIAREPHGNGGFGYDPVFIEKESGKCFAEMSPTEKNAVSHRGRAMRKLRDFLGILAVIIISFLTPEIAMAAQWRLHPSFDGQMITIADSPSYTYFLGTKQQYLPQNSNASILHGVLFRYDKEGDELTYLNSMNSLAGNTVKAIAYNYGKKYLAVAYDDGTIDFVYDNGNVKTIRGLKTADPSLDKIVNDFTFDNDSGKVYAATNFGYLIIDEIKGEIDTSRNFNRKINSAALYNGILWLGTEDGLYFGKPGDFNMSDYRHISEGKNISLLSRVGNDLYFTCGYGNAVTCSKVSYSDGNASETPVSYATERTIQRGDDAIMTVSNSRIRWIDKNGSYTYYDLPSGYESSIAGSRDGKTFWMSTDRKGISSLKAPDQNGKWTLVKDRFFPNASNSFMCAAMEYHPDYGMLVRNHGYEINFAGAIVTTNDLISGYKNMTWTPLSTTYRTDMGGLLIDSPFGIAIDPNNRDHVYCGSERTGLLRLDLKNPEKSIHFSKQSDYLGGYGKPGFAVIVPENPPGTWEQQCTFAAPVFDANGNLWTAYVNPVVNANDVSSYTEMWVWPAAARAASTDASNVQGWKKIKIDGLSSSGWPVMLPLKSGANKNIVIHAGNSVSDAMLVYNHNGTIDNTSDDKYVKVKTIIDQDGNSLSFPRAYALYEDPETGLVWVSNGDGVFTFDPVNIFKDPTSVRRIKVARNDGTNLADFLLNGVLVNCITSDPSGRKWFATNGAGVVCTSSDGRQVLAAYTKDNSDLPGDDVYSLCYNPADGSMMMSTNNGLCELFLDGTSQSDSSDVKIFPNPVRPDYFGYVTVEGLPQNAMVKIVDTAGNLVKECGQAYNGSIEWDVTNIFTKRVPGGVYFVVATNGPDSDSYNKVGKILVVN